MSKRAQDFQDFKNALIAGLELELPYVNGPIDFKNLPKRKIEAAVLALFALDQSEVPHLLLTQRSEKVATHRGHMAFTGGRIDPKDRDLDCTALRETEEEVGIAPGEIEIIGVLPELPTLSTGYWISPRVGMLRVPIEEITLTPSAEEIAEVFWAPLEVLSEPTRHRLEWRSGPSSKYQTHVFDFEEREIWGATALMIRNLLDRMRLG